MKKFADEHGYQVGSQERTGSYSYDSTQIKDGVYYDIKNDFVGLDVSQPFDLINSKFRKWYAGSDQ